MNKTGGKSDASVVPEKQANKETNNFASAESVEERGATKGKMLQHNTGQTQSWETVQSKLLYLHQKAKADKKLRFTSLMHHVWNPETLMRAYHDIKSSASAGVDGETYAGYGKSLEINLTNLSGRLKQGAYHAKPVRRVYIPKADGKQRPIGVTVLEDKIVQRATAMVLNAIYEADFLGFSYGFRPKRSQHQALDAVYAGLLIKRINWILDADIQNFFGKVNHGWVLKFVEHRIADPRVLRLVRKWLNAGVMENGVLSFEEDGTPQGGSISPLIANIYLHYVLDLWTQNMREKQLKGDVIVVRYADDSITGFQYKSEAEYYLQDLRLRLAKFGLSLNEEKTRLLEFGKYAISRRKEQGSGKPETFNFLGFTHICGKSRKGKFTILRYTINKRMRSKMLSIKQQLRKRMHMKVSLVGKWLTSVLSGYFRYYGVSGNIGKLDQFRYGILMRWFKILKRRSQQRRLSWSQMSTIANRWLPRPKVYYKHPLSRIGVTT